jgi:hypothetical protein
MLSIASTYSTKRKCIDHKKLIFERKRLIFDVFYTWMIFDEQKRKVEHRLFD